MTRIDVPYIPGRLQEKASSAKLKDEPKTSKVFPALGKSIGIRLGLCWLYLVTSWLHAAPTPVPAEADLSDLLELSLEELMNTEIVSAATLTTATRRETPSTMIRITQEQIRHSGARNLFEILDMYLPNFKWACHRTNFRNMGLRGIIGWEDKYLILVNGRIMNEKTSAGAVTERDLPLLTDIHHIDVVRGSGSALHGPGALAMVINLVTEDAETFQGHQTSLRGGMIERFMSVEHKWGHKFAEGSGLYWYGGISDYRGAYTEYSPQVYGRNVWILGQKYGPKDEVSVASDPWNQSFRSRPRWKTHLAYTKDKFKLWGRISQGGEQFQSLWASTHRSGGYWQGTVHAENEIDLSDTLTFTTVMSYDRTAIDEEPHYKGGQDTHAEDEFLTKAVLRYNPNEKHSVAAIGSWAHERFGLDYEGVARSANTAMSQWYTDLYSLVGEYRVRLDKHWTAFFGSRWDWHTHTYHMFSPRASLVFMPSDSSTIKLIVSRANRTNWARPMHDSVMSDGKRTEPETLKATELRWDQLLSEHSSMGLSIFHHSHDYVAWAGSLGYASIGNIKSCGAELEYAVKTERTRFDINHSFTKMLETNFVGSEIGNNKITAGAYDYGNDLNHWDNHITKLVYNYDCTERTNFNTSLQYYWGQPGGRDFADWRKSKYKRGDYEPYSATAFWTLGLEHRIQDNLVLRIDGHNLVALFDAEMSKKRIHSFNEPGFYRLVPAGVSASLYYKFK